MTGTAGVIPDGDVHFYVCPDESDACTSTSPGVVDLGSTILSGSGSGDSATATSAAFTPTANGLYCFTAVFSGDNTYGSTTDQGNESECFTVASTAPATLTTEPANSFVILGGSDTDTATVTGTAGVIPDGDVHFYVCPDESDACTSTSPGVVDLGSTILSGSGSGDSATATSAAFTPTANGLYCFTAVFSGDNTYGSTTDQGNESECFTVGSTTPAPVGLGSPENSFGTGDLPLGPNGSPTATPTNVWAAVNGYCTSKENGDEFLSAFDATFDGSGFDCPLPPNTSSSGPRDPDATTNFEYNPVGYVYDIETPDQTPDQAIGRPITVQAYDPSFNPGGCSSGVETADNGIGTDGSQITTTFSLYYTPVPTDTPSPANQIGNTYTATTGDQTTCGMWVTIGVIPATAEDGTYQLAVASQADQAKSDGTNAYGLRLYQGTAAVPSPVANGVGPWARCSTDTTSPYYSSDTSCPVIQGQSALSVYVNSASSTGSFYLADIDPSYDGRNMEISLFDPGEGDHYIQILGPDGQPVPFTYTTTDACSSTDPVYPPADSGNTTDCAGPGGIDFPSPVIAGSSSDQGGEQDVLDVSGSITPPPGEESSSEFNDRHLQLTVQIPPDSRGAGGRSTTTRTAP